MARARGTNMEFITPLVEVGNVVSRGDPIGYGMNYYNGQQSAEFGLVDRGRTDGFWVGYGAAVSPYDYLVESYKAHTVDKYGRTPKITLYFKAYQPYLTNRLLLHIWNEGNLTGEWLLVSSDWEIRYPNDIITITETEVLAVCSIISALAIFPLSRFHRAITTVAPILVRALAVAFPMSELLPVTMMVLPSIMLDSFLIKRNHKAFRINNWETV